MWAILTNVYLVLVSQLVVTGLASVPFVVYEFIQPSSDAETVFYVGLFATLVYTSKIWWGVIQLLHFMETSKLPVFISTTTLFCTFCESVGFAAFIAGLQHPGNLPVAAGITMACATYTTLDIFYINSRVDHNAPYTRMTWVLLPFPTVAAFFVLLVTCLVLALEIELDYMNGTLFLAQLMILYNFAVDTLYLVDSTSYPLKTNIVEYLFFSAPLFYDLMFFFVVTLFLQVPG